MRCFSSFGVLLLPACFALAGTRAGTVLDYELRVRMADETAWVEGGFRLVTTPALVTGNRVKKPRMGGWRLEPKVDHLGAREVVPSAVLLARVAGLMYFSGPAPELAMRATGRVLGGRFCRLWQAPTAPGMGAYVYLAEVAPHLLALSYLSASLGEGDIDALEIHLVKVELGAHPCPAEEGGALLRTLGSWRPRAPQALGKKMELLESEEID